MNSEPQRYASYLPIVYEYVKELPAEWRLLPNIALFQERNEKGFPDEELLSVTIKSGVIKQADVETKKDSSKEDKSNYKLVREGDIAMNKMRMWQGALGVSDYLGIVSPAYTVLRTRGELNTRYFHYLFRSRLYTNYSRRNSYGIADDVLTLRYTHFKRMYSIVPPRDAQDAIVTYLDTIFAEIEKLIRRKKRLIALYEEERDAVIRRFVTKGVRSDSKLKDSGVDWIGAIPQHWQISKIRFEGLLQAGISKAGSFFGSGSPFISYKDVYTSSELRLSSNLALTTRREQGQFSIRKGDAFFTRTSETDDDVGVASTCLSDIPNATYSGFIIRFRRFNTRIDDKYLMYYLSNQEIRKYFQKYMNLVTRVSLSQGLLKGLHLLIPSYDEQQEIVRRIENESTIRDKLIDRANLEIQRLEEYRDSLVIAAVTGGRNVIRA